jgi:hypothetical protein
MTQLFPEGDIILIDLSAKTACTYLKERKAYPKLKMRWVCMSFEHAKTPLEGLVDDLHRLNKTDEQLKEELQEYCVNSGATIGGDTTSTVGGSSVDPKNQNDPKTVKAVQTAPKQINTKQKKEGKKQYSRKSSAKGWVFWNHAFTISKSN